MRLCLSFVIVEEFFDLIRRLFEFLRNISRSLFRFCCLFCRYICLCGVRSIFSSFLSGFFSKLFSYCLVNSLCNSFVEFFFIGNFLEIIVEDIFFGFFQSFLDLDCAVSENIFHSAGSLSNHFKNSLAFGSDCFFDPCICLR